MSAEKPDDAPDAARPTPPAEGMRDRMVAYVKGLQSRIRDAYAALDPDAVVEERSWDRAGGGGGTMIVLRGPRVEKAGVNVSVVHGDASPMTGRPFFATGVSTIVHCFNPHAPTVHMNVRYFEEPEGRWWFGGGMDLTPMGFPYADDTAHFHNVCRDAVESVVPGGYEPFRKWADEYFFVKHRGRVRGVGGVFFDERSGDAEREFALVRSVGDRFLDAYVPIARRRLDQPFTEAEKEAQLRARGVYAEFNLAYDRGTRFGFESGGNVDAILVSMPPVVKW